MKYLTASAYGAKGSHTLMENMSMRRETHPGDESGKILFSEAVM